MKVSLAHSAKGRKVQDQAAAFEDDFMLCHNMVDGTHGRNTRGPVSWHKKGPKHEG
jgi:hypothetical protein